MQKLAKPVEGALHFPLSYRNRFILTDPYSLCIYHTLLLRPEYNTIPDWKLRLYQIGYTSSRKITEVKQLWAGLIAGWVTTRYYSVL